MSVNLAAADSELTESELESLLVAAQRGQDRRADTRHALFAVATLRSANAPSILISAFSREIACDSIGLLHAIPVMVGELYSIDIRLDEVRFRRNARVVWCRPTGEEWFLSGWQFV